ALQHMDSTHLILLYDNESYANTDIQASGSTPYGANTTFSPHGKAKRILHKRWKKNMAAMLAAGHPECRYVGTVCASYAVDFMNRIRKALSIGGPTFIHSLDPCPKGWDYDPMLSHELGELAVLTGIWPLFDVENHTLRLYGKSKGIVEGRQKRDRKSTRLNSSHQINTLSLHDALPISDPEGAEHRGTDLHPLARPVPQGVGLRPDALARAGRARGPHGHLAPLRCGEPHAAPVREEQGDRGGTPEARSEEHTSELQSPDQHAFPTRRSSDLGSGRR